MSCFTGLWRNVKAHQAPDCELPQTAWGVRYYPQPQPTLHCGHACTRRGKLWSETRHWLSGSRWHTPNFQSPWRWWGDRGLQVLGQKQARDNFWVVQPSVNPIKKHTDRTGNRDHCIPLHVRMEQVHRERKKKRKEYTWQWSSMSWSNVYLLPGLLATKLERAGESERERREG